MKDEDILRKFLIFLRKQDLAKTLTITGVIFIISSAVGVILDWLLPFEGWGMIARSITLIPIALSLFSFSYLGLLNMGAKRASKDDNWKPIRMRIPQKARNSMAILAVFIMVALAYTRGFGLGYTFTSGVLLSALIGLYAFIRPTKQEIMLAKAGLTDPRETYYASKIHRASLEAGSRRKKKRKAKK